MVVTCICNVGYARELTVGYYYPVRSTNHGPGFNTYTITDDRGKRKDYPQELFVDSTASAHSSLPGMQQAAPQQRRVKCVHPVGSELTLDQTYDILEEDHRAGTFRVMNDLGQSEDYMMSRFVEVTADDGQVGEFMAARFVPVALNSNSNHQQHTTDALRYAVAGILDGYCKTPVIGGLKATCNHQWKQYQGLTDSFEYCTVCDAKKGKAG